MHCIFRSINRRPGRHSYSYQSRRTLVDISTIKWVRDRALDHAVEKEAYLVPMLNLKNLIKSEPSKTIPLSIVADNRDSLRIPLRPIEFVRKFPSVFNEFYPGGIEIHPHFKLSPEILSLDAEEQLIYQSESFKQQGADRLLKLLMISETHKIPLTIIDRLRWDLGLPKDYAKTMVPEFPDYFRVCDSDSCLELVCWSNDHAVSMMEKKAMATKDGYEKGKPLSFPLQYSRGFEINKTFKKWVDQWQNLPYVSPYENAMHIPAKSDEADKWAVAVLHEILHLLISKKTDKENLFCLGEHLGLKSRFKIALLQHPGIFYVSNKFGTYTVVLRDGYKRNLLIENHILMDMRSKYIHLMHTAKKVDKKRKDGESKKSKEEKQTGESVVGEELKSDKSEDEEEDDEVEGSYGSDSMVEDDSDDEHCGQVQGDRRTSAHTNERGSRGRTGRNSNFEVNSSFRRSSANNSREGRHTSRTWKRESADVPRRAVRQGRCDDNYSSEDDDKNKTHSRRERTSRNSTSDANEYFKDSFDSNRVEGRYPSKTWERGPRTGPLRTMKPERRDNYRGEDRSGRSDRMDSRGTRGRTQGNSNIEGKSSFNTSRDNKSFDGRYASGNKKREPTDIPTRRNTRDSRTFEGEGSDFSEKRGRSKMEARTSP